jgi:alkylhydroperoxidase family enzyme
MPPLPDPLPAEVQELFEARLKRTGRILNIHHTFGHVPKLSRASMQMAMTLRYETSTPRLYIEIAIVRIGHIAKGKYELQQHEPMLAEEGFPKNKIKAIKNWKKSKLFDDKERAVLAFTDEVANLGNVSDRTYKNLLKHFTPQQALELTFAAASYYGTVLVMNTMKIKLEKKP